jgi:hypothetical protein
VFKSTEASCLQQEVVSPAAPAAASAAPAPAAAALAAAGTTATTAATTPTTRATEAARVTGVAAPPLGLRGLRGRARRLGALKIMIQRRVDLAGLRFDVRELLACALQCCAALLILKLLGLPQGGMSRLKLLLQASQ